MPGIFLTKIYFSKMDGIDSLQNVSEYMMLSTGNKQLLYTSCEWKRQALMECSMSLAVRKGQQMLWKSSP